MKKLFLISASLICFPACTETKDTPAPEVLDMTKLETVYQDRFKAYVEGYQAGLNAYDPLKVVNGSPDYEPFQLNKSEYVSEDAIKSAKTYLADRNTTSFMIWHEGKLIAREYYGDQKQGDTINSRSLAKPLGVIAVGRAIQEGHIKSIDQPASDYFEEWKSDDRSKILIRHLLDMRTGLMAQSQQTDPNHIMNRSYLHPAHDKIIIDEYPLINQPGTRYDYSNANSELVAPLIERATGIQYEDWISQEILEPLGAKGGEVWMNREGGTAHAGCCILLPPETFLRMAVLYLQDGKWDGDRLLPDGYVKEVSTGTAQYPHAGMGVYVAGDYVEGRGPTNPDVPYGKTKHGEPYLADDLFLFDGNGHQVAYIIPSANMVIFRSGTWPAKELGWDNSILPNTILAGTEFPDGKRPVRQK
jgi:CubicO group peptidase (beta-lactamase class C family)